MSDKDERRFELIETIAGTITEQVTGIDMVGGALGLLRDSPGREPVVPPDLHLVKPAPVDADGNVDCIVCGAKVAFSTATMVGHHGFSCGRHNAEVAIAPPADVTIKRRMWPWVVGIGAAIAGAVWLMWHHHAVEVRERLASELPFEATSADRDVIDRNLDRWSFAGLVASLGQLPAIDRLRLGAPCDLDIANRMQLDLARPDDVERKLRDLRRQAEAGRFETEWSRLSVVTAIAGPVVAFHFTTDKPARIVRPVDRPPYFDAGHRAGTAYVLDPDGTLRCAAAFDAESSERIKYDSFSTGDRDTPNQMTDIDKTSAGTELEADLDRHTNEAVKAALRRVD